MAESDYNLIKPVEGLQNVGTLNPIQGNTEKKRKQGEEQRKRSTAAQPDKTTDKNATGAEPPENEDDRHSIDFRA